MLNNKSELQKAMEKHKELAQQKLENRIDNQSEFDRMLMERAQRLLKVAQQKKYSMDF